MKAITAVRTRKPFRLLLTVALIAMSSREAAAGDAAVVTTTTSTTTTGDTLTTSSSVTTSSSILEDYENELMLAVFPARPIASLALTVRARPDYGPDNASCKYFGPQDAGQGFSGPTTLQFTALRGGDLDRSQSIVLCSYYTHEPHGPLDADSFSVQGLRAKDKAGSPVPVALCAVDFDEEELGLPGSGDCRYACGDAICDGGEPTSTDALAVLRRAVGLYACPDNLCDVNDSGDVSATDARIVLRRSTGLSVKLLCPLPGCYWTVGDY